VFVVITDRVTVCPDIANLSSVDAPDCLNSGDQLPPSRWAAAAAAWQPVQIDCVRCFTGNRMIMLSLAGKQSLVCQVQCRRSSAAASMYAEERMLACYHRRSTASLDHLRP
jgi:hypothetical protein